MSSTYNDPLISWGRQIVILLILITNRITDRMLPPRYTYLSENEMFIHVWKVWSSSKCFMKMGSLLSQSKSLSMPYGHVS